MFENNTEFDYEKLQKYFESKSNFEVHQNDFENLTLVFEVKKLNFETSTKDDFNTRNTEAD
jgi:hypothetical protein